MLSLFTTCSVQLGTKRNHKEVEEKLVGFVLVYKLACTELHGSDSFVKCVSRFCVKIRLCESNIRQRSSVDRRAYYNAIQMFLLFSSRFFSRIQPKKVEGLTFLGFVLLI